MAMAIALARTARPASCPPMRRESSGSVADTVVASAFFGSFLFWPGAPVADDEGETVGNSPDGSVGEVSEPSGSEIPGSESPTDELVDESEGELEPEVVEVLAATTLIVAALSNEVALLAFTVAVSVIFSPTGAASRTRTAASSSSLCFVGKSPTVQASPFGAGHTVNCGDSTCVVLPMLTVTVAVLLSAPVLHTYIS
jgi:hypothetical protein